MPEIDLALTVAKQVEEMRKAGGYPSDEAFVKLATQVGMAFQAKKDEVAMLKVSPDGRMLSFLYPSKLARVGSIPLTVSHSLAAKTIRDKRGEIVNNFAIYKHPTVFEAVDLSDAEKAAPIQKIMSAPMIVDGKVVGVMQVSRKGRAGDAPGPDFTPHDLADLTNVGGILGRLVVTLPSPPLAAKKPAAKP